MMNKDKVNSSRVPVYRDAGFELYNADNTERIFADEINAPAEPEMYIYSRYRNPTVVAAEEKIAGIERSKWALLTQSGMSAVDVALSVFQDKDIKKPWMFFSEIYGGTNSYIDSVLVNRRGVDVVRMEPENGVYDPGKVERIIAEKRPSVLFFEIISNPLLIVSDIRKIVSIARKHGTRVIIDNTFATPFLISPLEHGADLVVHSATKYLGGHGNITAGVICGNDEKLRIEACNYRKFTGHMLSPDDAYRLTTQMDTFNLRISRQFSNSMDIALALDKHRAINKVWYPGLPGHKTHDVAKSLFGNKGYGAIVTFDIRGDDARDKKNKRDTFIERVSKNIKLIPTLGDSHTILMPVEPVWGYKYPEPGMIRLSVGFEEPGYIKNIINEALLF